MNKILPDGLNVIINIQENDNNDKEKKEEK